MSHLTLNRHQPLVLPIQTRWDGTACPDPTLHGEVHLTLQDDGLLLTARLPWRAQARIPDAPPGARISNLWTFDVVECFLAGPDGYLEVELGAGGHFLLLSFTGPRALAQTFEDFLPTLHFSPGNEGQPWESRIFLPSAVLPPGLERVNAYVIAEGEYLCFQALPGEKPDFHQPARFAQMKVQTPAGT